MAHTILLIDYEPRSLEQMQTALKGAGYKVHTAHDGLQGLTRFRELSPDLTLIEAMIPKKHGFEVCQELKQTQHGNLYPVILMSAVYKGQKYRQQAEIDYGADGYIEKPISSQDLLDLIQEHLKDRAPNGAVDAGQASETPSSSENDPSTMMPPQGDHPSATYPISMEMSPDDVEVPLAELKTQMEPMNEGDVLSHIDQILPDSGQQTAQQHSPLTDDPSPAVLGNLEESSDEPDYHQVLNQASEEIEQAQAEDSSLSGPMSQLKPGRMQSNPALPTSDGGLDASLDAALGGSPENSPHLSTESSQPAIGGLAPGEELQADDVPSLKLAGEAAPSKPALQAGSHPSVPQVATSAESLPLSNPQLDGRSNAPWEREVGPKEASLPIVTEPEPFERPKSAVPLWVVAAAGILIVGALLGWYFLGPGQAKETNAQAGSISSNPSATELSDRQVNALTSRESGTNPSTLDEAPIELNLMATDSGNETELANATTANSQTEESLGAQTQNERPTSAPANDRPTAANNTSNNANGPTQTQETVQRPIEQPYLTPSNPVSAKPATNSTETAAAEPTQNATDGGSTPATNRSAGSNAEASSSTDSAAVAENNMNQANPSQSEPSQPIEAAPLETFEPIQAAPATVEPIKPVKTTQPGDYVPLTEVDARPRAINQTPPQYEARELRGRSVVRVNLTLRINDFGQVVNTQWVSGEVSSSLKSKTLRAVENWRFEPARKDGVPVQTDLPVTFNFKR